MVLNPNKTRISSVGNKVKLLGVVILPNGKISVDAKLKNFVETALYLYSKDTLMFRDFLEMDIGSAMERVSGYVNYISTVDASYVDFLRRRYGVTVVDTFIHYSKK
jgi:RNA-directed DNA polymerase